MKFKVIRRTGVLWGTGRWEVVSVPFNQWERQLFGTRDEARLFARIRRKSATFLQAVHAYANS